MLENKDFVSGNNMEKNLGSKEKKEFIKKFSKPISAALLSAMISTASASDMDISKLPHYASVDCEKYGPIKVCIKKGYDFDSHYDTDYYDRYNNEIANIEDTNLKGIEYLGVIGGKLYLQGYDYDLVSVSEIIPDERFLKKYDLDTVVININGANFKANPKFLKLSFSRNGKKGFLNYYAEKEITLVYVPYLDKIKVLGIIDNYAGFIETTPRDYEVVGEVETKKQLYYHIAKLLSCKHSCRYKKTFNQDIYFYSNGKLMGIVQDMGEEKIILKNNKVVGKFIQNSGKVILLDKNGKVIYRYSGSKPVDITIPEIEADIKLLLNN